MQSITKLAAQLGLAMAAQIAHGLAALLLLLGALCSLVSENAEGAGNSWDKWSVAPYATSLEEACKKAPAAIDGFSMPAAAKEHFKQAISTTCKGGTEVWLTPNMSVEQMWSGGRKPHVMNKVTVGELPVLKSPDGRPYRKGSVAETAKALSWTFVHEGKTYVLYLPLVCFNWSWTFSSPPPTMLVCATVGYTVVPGDEIRFAVLARKLLPASACWQLCDGDVCSAPPSPCTADCWSGLRPFIPFGFEPLHSGKYIARSARQVLRFPLEVMNEYIALCDFREGLGESDSWIIQPSAWSIGVTTIAVPYGGQEWPAWGKVDLSKWRKP